MTQPGHYFSGSRADGESRPHFGDRNYHGNINNIYNLHADGDGSGNHLHRGLPDVDLTDFQHHASSQPPQWGLRERFFSIWELLNAKQKVYLRKWPNIVLQDYPELFKTKAIDDYQNQLESLRQNVQPGTCSWVMKTPEFRKWECGKDYQLLWLIGNAGMGKSTLTAHVISEMRGKSKDSAVLFIFAAVSDTYSISDLLCAAIYQLINGSETLRDMAVRHDNTYSIDEGRPGMHGPTRNPDDLWSLLGSVVEDSGLPRFYLVVDGLDNLPSEMQKELMSLMNAGPRKLRVLVTSKPLEELRLALFKSRFQRLDASDYEPMINADIQVLLEKKIREIGEKRKWDEEQEKETLEFLSRQKAGIFLPFVLCFTWLEWTEGLAVRKGLRDYFNNMKALDATFESLVKLMSTKCHGKRSKILDNVIYAQRPLTVAELGSICGYGQGLEIASGASTSRPSIVSKSLEGLRQDVLLYGPMLRIVKQDDTVDFIHPAARRFLIEAISSGRHKHLLIEEPDEAQYNFAKSCLEALQECSSGTYPSKSDDRFAAKLQLAMATHSFLSYAFENWHYHVRMALRSESAEYKSMAKLKPLEQKLGALARVFLDSDRQNFAALLGKRGKEYILPRKSVISFYALLGSPIMVDKWLAQHKDALSRKEHHEDLCLALEVAIRLGDLRTSGSLLACIDKKALDTDKVLAFVAKAGQSGDERILREVLDFVGRRPLLLAETAITACSLGHDHLLDVLAEESEDLLQQDGMGMSVLHRLATYPCDSRYNARDLLKAMRYFISNQCLKPNGEDKLGHTVLHHLCWDRTKNDCETIKVIVEMGADPRHTNKFGCQPIHLAALRGKGDLMRYLIDRIGTKAAVVCSRGDLTPLHWAMCRRFSTDSLEEDFSVLQQLLCKGARLDAVSKTGRTPISIGSENPSMRGVLSLVFYRLDGIDNMNSSLECFTNVWVNASTISDIWDGLSLDELLPTKYLDAIFEGASDPNRIDGEKFFCLYDLHPANLMEYLQRKYRLDEDEKERLIVWAKATEEAPDVPQPEQPLKVRMYYYMDEILEQDPLHKRDDTVHVEREVADEHLIVTLSVWVMLHTVLPYESFVDRDGSHFKALLSRARLYFAARGMLTGSRQRRTGNPASNDRAAIESGSSSEDEAEQAIDNRFKALAESEARSGDVARQGIDKVYHELKLATMWWVQEYENMMSNIGDPSTCFWPLVTMKAQVMRIHSLKSVQSSPFYNIDQQLLSAIRIRRRLG